MKGEGSYNTSNEKKNYYLKAPHLFESTPVDA